VKKKIIVFKFCCEIDVFPVQFAGFFIFLLGGAFISLQRVAIFCSIKKTNVLFRMSPVTGKKVGIRKYCITAMDPCIFHSMLKHRMADENRWKKECASTITSFDFR